MDSAVLVLRRLTFLLFALGVCWLHLGSSAGAEAIGPQGLAFVGVNGSNSGVWTANVDGSAPHLLAAGGKEPALSQSGLRVAYVQGNCIHWISVSGGPTEESPCGYESAPRDLEWAPSEDSLYFRAPKPATMLPRWGRRRVPSFVHRSEGFGAGPGALARRQGTLLMSARRP
jgi:hypothetical protein